MAFFLTLLYGGAEEAMLEDLYLTIVHQMPHLIALVASLVLPFAYLTPSLLSLPAGPSACIWEQISIILLLNIPANYEVLCTLLSGGWVVGPTPIPHHIDDLLIPPSEDCGPPLSPGSLLSVHR